MDAREILIENMKSLGFYYDTENSQENFICFTSINPDYKKSLIFYGWQEVEDFLCFYE